MKRVSTVLVLIGLLAAPAAANPVENCVGSDDPVTCAIEDFDPAELACVGFMRVPLPEGHLARDTAVGVHPELDAEAGTIWIGIVVADGDSGGDLGNEYDSFVFIGGTTDASSCDLLSTDKGKLDSYWYGRTWTHVVWANQFAEGWVDLIMSLACEQGPCGE